MTEWIKILADQVKRKSRSVVCKELDISASTLSLVLSNQYPAKTEKIEKRVMDLYGLDGTVNCPVLGKIETAKCVENFTRAQFAKAGGNPHTIRLHIACRKCDFRN